MEHDSSRDQEQAVRWWRRSATRSDKARLEAMLAGFIAIGAVGAWAFSPIIRFANPSALLAGSVFIVIGLLTNTIIPWHRNDVPVTALSAPLFPIILGAIFLYAGAQEAIRKSQWNDRRCLKIQLALMQPKSGMRTDLADLFTALGCRTQGGPPADPNYVPPSRYGPPPNLAAEQQHGRFLDAALENEVSVMEPLPEPGSKQTAKAPPAATDK